MGTYLSAQQIHKCIVTLTLSLFVGFGFILQLNVPAARSEEYTTQISRRPNILFVMTDDQPIKDTMIAMPEIRERVRDRGMTLPNAYVSESLCCPSRASILRAQYPHNTGVMRNGPPDGGVQIFHAFEGIGLRMPLGSRLLELVVNKSSLQNPRERMLRLAVWERNWYRKSCGKRSSLSCPPNRRNRRAADLASTTGPRWPASSSSSRAASPGRCSRRRWAAGRAARAGGGCVGTDGPDLLTGSGGGDDMDGRQDSDRLIGNEGSDWMLGDTYAAPNNDTSTDGNDIIKGGPGFDGLAGLGGDDLLRGGDRSDYIFAEESSVNEGEDTVYGSMGNDYIEAKDRIKDTINCSGGTRDIVFFDKGDVDTVTNCEYKNPDFQEFSVASASSTPAKVSAKKLNALRAR